MQLCNVVLRSLSALLISSSAVFADNGQTSNGKGVDPFVDQFLPICGQFAISGTPSALWASDIGKAAASLSQLEIGIEDNFAICRLVVIYHSNVADIEEARRPRFQPRWLQDPDRLSTAFDSWIRGNESDVDLRPTVNCQRKQESNDPITKVLYSRAVSIGDTRRIIAVTITRTLESYLDPDRGYTIALAALAFNGPANCAK